MERDKKLAWFLAADDRAKAAVLASAVHLMTVEVRGVHIDGDLQVFHDVAYRISEATHRITAKISEMLSGQPTYPDELIINGIFDVFAELGIEHTLDRCWPSFERRAIAATRSSSA